MHDWKPVFQYDDVSPPYLILCLAPHLSHDHRIGRTKNNVCPHRAARFMNVSRGPPCGLSDPPQHA